jgi:hypothetical protein
MHLSSAGIQPKLTTLAFALLLVTLWLFVRGYHGLTGDGQIYAFQALARIHPSLASDLYLQNTSQDQFTVFSPLYAWFIGLLGLEQTARLLTIIFTVWLLAAASSFVRAVAGRDSAWLAAAFLLVIPGDYGGAGVFNFSEQFLTARLPAEALVLTSLACHARNMKHLGTGLAISALFVHPLIALPGLFLLICLSLPNRACIVGAVAGALTVLGIAIATTILPTVSHVLTVMDAAWLEVVRERSQFLFLQLWSVQDWDVNTRPFIYLGLTAIVVPDDRIRKLCMASALVGAAGLAVALIAGAIGPVAILVQGQAWRWVWITAFIAALLLPVTALQVWRDEKCAPLCLILMVLGWLLPAMIGTASVSLALILWLKRRNLSTRVAMYLRWTAAGIGLATVAWLSSKSWLIVSQRISPSGSAPIGAGKMPDVVGLKIAALMFGAAVWTCARSSRTIWLPASLCGLLAATSIVVWPAAFKQSHTFASDSDIDEFADWTNAIPATSTVLVAPAHDVGAFVWFTLERPNYLALDQSAGVVFSRATALEVQRRSEILLPLMDPDWKILTSLRTAAAPGQRNAAAATRPLTAKSLILVCADPQLGFVMSPENVDFDPIRHDRAGPWKGWNLYDCRKVRSRTPPA